MADSTNEQPAPVTLHVCVTCLKPGEPFEPREARSGARLYYALESALDPGTHGAIEIVPVACLSSCKRSCNVAVSSPGKWTYVYGDLAPVRQNSKVHLGNRGTGNGCMVKTGKNLSQRSAK